MMNREQGYGRTILWTLAVTALLALPARGQSVEEIPLGSSMPMANQALPDVQGGQASLSALSGDRGTVVMFWSNQCPWVERYEDRFTDLAGTFSARGISFVLVNSNDADAYPQEAREASAQRVQEGNYPSGVTYLIDTGSSLARAFGAERTPHAFVFDANDRLVYVGTIDDSPGDPANVSETYLESALDAVATGAEVTVPETKAFGCTIKLKS